MSCHQFWAWIDNDNDGSEVVEPQLFDTHQDARDFLLGEVASYDAGACGYISHYSDQEGTGVLAGNGLYHDEDFGGQGFECVGFEESAAFCEGRQWPDWEVV